MKQFQFNPKLSKLKNDKEHFKYFVNKDNFNIKHRIFDPDEQCEYFTILFTKYPGMLLRYYPMWKDETAIKPRQFLFHLYDEDKLITQADSLRDVENYLVTNGKAEISTY